MKAVWTMMSAGSRSASNTDSHGDTTPILSLGKAISEAQRIVTPSGEVLVILPLAMLQPFVTTTEQALEDAFDTGESPVAVWRKQRGLSQSGLARLAGVSRFTVMRKEEAGAGAGNLNSRRRIASALDIPITAI